MSHKPFLMMSPYFPPMGVSGAKRSLHLAMNLPDFGWRPIVLASKPVSEPRDTSLLEAVPRSTIVSYGYTGLVRPSLRRLLGKKKTASLGSNSSAGRARIADALRPGREVLKKFFDDVDITFLTPFDRFMLDTPAGISKGLELVRIHKPKAIHVSADPWSGLVAAYVLQRFTGLPLVVDLRDPWSLHEAKMALRPRLSRGILKRFERALFARASKIVLNTETCMKEYIKAYAGTIPESRFTFVRNAFEYRLFKDETSKKPDQHRGAFTVMYFGRFRKFVGPDRILGAFRQFVSKNDLGPDRARLVFVGPGRDEQALVSLLPSLESHVEIKPSVPFRESLAVLQSADVLVLVVEPASKLQIPGKLYDYLAAGRTILAISANPEVNSILERTGAGVSANYDHVTEAAAKLTELYQAYLENSGVMHTAASDSKLEPFTARFQVQRFAEILNEVTA